MLVQASTLITDAKAYADASDPNAGAWIDTPTWQEWLDSVYAVLFDRLLYSGALTPATTDTSFVYDPSVGYMSLAASACRVIVDVFRVTGATYELVTASQHVTQFPNLDLQPVTPYPGVGTTWPGFPGSFRRSWSAFLVPHDNTVRINVSPPKLPDNYLVRTVSDPDISAGYQMPPVAKEWVALCMARRAFAREGVVSQAVNQLHGEADDALQAYLESFMLRHDRKVSLAPWGGVGNPGYRNSGWWWRP